jgi:glycosyltransferase involved in cell wall biosynthesis
MKILIATGIYPPDIGGPATYAKFLAVELPKKSIDVEVLSFGEVRKYPKIFRHLIYFFRILRMSRGVDVIFTQDPVSTGLPVILASFINGKKVVMRVAGDYAWEQSCQRYGVKESIDDFQNKKYGLRVESLRFIQRFTVQHADRVYSPSKYFSQLVAGWNDGKKEVMAVYNGIDLSMTSEVITQTDSKTIISAGRLVPWKGFDVLIRSLPMLPEWKLLIAGDGKDEARLLQLAKDLRVDDRVRLLGNLPRAELFKQIAKSEIFALLSTFESFSFQIVEAMYLGKPVIAAKIGNIPEIITDGGDGLLIEPGKEDVLVRAVNRIKNDKSFATTLSQNAKKRAEDFSFTKTIENLVAILNEVKK